MEEQIQQTIYRDISIAWFNDIQNYAIVNNIFFDLSLDNLADMMETQNHQCFYSGELLSFPRLSRTPVNEAKLTFINPSLGYTLTNLRWVSKDVFTLKRTMTEEEFIAFCVNIAARMSE
jgi:hypothetical protein